MKTETKIDGITILEKWEDIPSGSCRYRPENKWGYPHYRSRGQCVGLCKRLMNSNNCNWILGSSFQGFYIVQDPDRIDQGLEKTWLILFN